VSNRRVPPVKSKNPQLESPSSLGLCGLRKSKFTSGSSSPELISGIGRFRVLVVGERERMGRGKVQLKRIEDKISRQVTFSKRKGGLMKKANELAVLCDVEVALLIFSDRGRLYEFCSAESLEEILERYRIHVDEEAAVCRKAELEKNLPEVTDLRTSANPLQMIQRHLAAQNIDQKNIAELTELEKELDAILRQTRSRKTQLLMEAARPFHEEEEQQRKEKTCMEEEMAAMCENLDNHYSHPLEPESNSHSKDHDPPLSPLQEDTLLHLF